MDSTTQNIKDQIEEARQGLTDNLASLEDRIKNKVKDISPLEQVRRHPFTAMGVSVATGLLVSKAFGSDSNRGSQVFSSLRTSFQPEWDELKREMMSSAAQAVGSWVGEIFPGHQTMIKRVVSRMAEPKSGASVPNGVNDN